MSASDVQTAALEYRHAIANDDDRRAIDGVLERAYGFLHAAVVLSAVELDVFSHLAAGPATCETLQRAVGIHERGARDFFDALTAYGLLVRIADEVYANAPVSDRYLDRAKPGYRGAMIEGCAWRSYRIWAGLPNALRTGRPQNETPDGGSFFDAIYRNPDALRRYHSAMLAQNAEAASAVAERVTWERCHIFADIGTGHGGLPVAVALAHRHLHGVGFDSPLVGPIFDEYVAAHGAAERVSFIAGDFFSDPLPAADVLVMGHILHNWSLDEKRRLLRKAFDRLPPHGALVIYEKLVDEGRTNLAALLSSLNQLLENAGGFEFTAADARHWLHDAGFARVEIASLVGDDSIIVASKTDAGGSWIR